MKKKDAKEKTTWGKKAKNSLESEIYGTSKNCVRGYSNKLREVSEKDHLKEKLAPQEL